MPIINTAKAIAGISSGQVLEVICTDPGSRADFDAWARSTGNQLISIKEEPGPPKLFQFQIKKS